MPDADKENGGHAHYHSKSNHVLSSRSESQPTPMRAALGTLAVNFPAEDPDEDRDVLASDGKTLRSRRSVLFYPSRSLSAKSNQAPFSRSAAKRDSIMALGSIGYLQHLFTKQGIASRKRPVAKGAMQLAIGPAGEVMFGSSASSKNPASRTGHLAEDDAMPPGTMSEEDMDEDISELPPSPRAGTYALPPFPNIPKPIEADADALRLRLAQDLAEVLQAWHLDAWVTPASQHARIRELVLLHSTKSNDASALSKHVTIPHLITSTTKAIRSVRGYILALPSGTAPIKAMVPIEPKRKDRFKRQSSFSGLPRPGEGSVVPWAGGPFLTPRNAAVASALEQSKQASDSSPDETQSTSGRSGRNNQSSSSRTEDDPLAILRKAALTLLSSLKDMEERHRLPGDESAGGEPKSLTRSDVQVGFHVRETPKLASKVVMHENQSTTELGLLQLPNNEQTEGGYLYRSDITLDSVAPERTALETYLATVDLILSEVRHPQRRPRPARHVSTSATTPSTGAATDDGPIKTNDLLNVPDITLASDAVDDGSAVDLDDDLLSNTRPRWADENNRRLGLFDTIHAFMLDHLPSESDAAALMQLTVDREDLKDLLDTLADGYLLCKVFNEAVRVSDKPWGYIQAREIHNLREEEAMLLLKEQERVRQAEEDGATPFQTRQDAVTETEDIDAVSSASLALSSEPSTRPGWTFRRTENLRVWAAALKLRYQIQSTSVRSVALAPTALGPTYGSLGMGKLALHGRRVASEASAGSHRSTTLKPSVAADKSDTTPLDFDPRKVARKEDGWHDMLTGMILRWIDEVAREQYP
ncbi:hypothetical protein BCV70DRAFT_216419 [Testicularia cyperi]|uniref:Calponin-homology (CH) domain-containing protein n=1 Tax=Testicularia cyperi TaxID=1882483 RepID=A0A317XS33_9BASI|nr:hypothetical protein BCV70DRAFT_216419 [Testicularia cyperi]